MMVTYTKSAEDKFTFELIRPVTSSDVYVAVGLSSDKKMANTTVMACAALENNEKFDVSMYWNTKSYDSKKLSEPQVGLSEISAKVEGGNLVCTFIR